MVRVWISGGGTGGHVYPLLAVAEVLLHPDGKELSADPRERGAELLYVGSVGGIEADIVGRTDIVYHRVDAAPIRGTTPFRLASNAYHLWRGYRQALHLLGKWPADVVLVSGAYVSVPVAFAARRRRVPVMVYLPDREPGLAVRLLSRFADSIAVSFDQVVHAFPTAVQRKVWVSGYPVRATLLSADPIRSRQMLGLDPAFKTVLVMGGSRGARRINQAVVAILSELLPYCQVIHIAGHLDWPWVKEVRGKLSSEIRPRYWAYPYLHENLAAAMAAADLAVARAGAATLAEFPAVGLPSVLVPYPYSGQHQQANAEFMVVRGASVRVDDAELDARLKQVVLDLLEDEDALDRMREAAQSLAKPDAASRLAKELFRLAQKTQSSRDLVRA
jgi:UDP-N-acetylglucosamine--N-acetylmuramyl-(pentapeptide) pyrophosphoryl-undecaprenol N-acetylglucosamine transferase